MSTISKTPPARSAGVDRGERLGGLGQVVDDVERGDQVVGGLLERERVAQLEAGVAEPQPLRLRPRGGDPLLGDVDPGHAARREGVRDQVRGVPVTAADVDDVDAAAKAVDEAVDERQRDLDQALASWICADSSAWSAWKRGISWVVDAAALAEALHHPLLELSEERRVLRERREVVGTGGARQARAVLGRQKVGARLGVVRDDPPTVTPASHSRT